MMFEWDPLKNAANLRKHGISFKEALEIFAGAILTADDPRRDYGELRYVSIGAISLNIVIVLAHTEREGRVRIISARKANRRERRLYHEHLKKTA